MNKLLPKTANNPKGFTLIELMIAIAIIAILAVIGMTVYGNVQRSARDSRRRADIESIAQAMEVAKANANSENYLALAATMFSSGAVPVDPGQRIYCASAPAAAAPAAWLAAVCPAGYNNIGAAGGTPGAAATFRVCASLESGTVHCIANQQ